MQQPPRSQKLRMHTMWVGMLRRFLCAPGKEEGSSSQCSGTAVAFLQHCAVCAAADPAGFPTGCCGTGWLRVNTPPQLRTSCGLNQQGAAHASLSSLLVYRNRCCKRSSRNDSPKKDEGKKKTICLFFQGRILLQNHLKARPWSG